MIFVISIFLIVLGGFFICLGLLFIDHSLSPLKKIVDKEYVYKNNRLAIQIILPGLILIILSSWIIISQR